MRRSRDTLRPTYAGNFREHGERLRDDLIHVVVLVGPEAADEVDAGRRRGEFLILLIQRRVLGAWNRIVRIPLALRILIDARRFRMYLPGEVLELGDPRVEVLVRIVHDRDRLNLLGVERFP